MLDLGEARLRDGSTMRIGLIEGPDPAWAPRLIPFLAHKPEPYLWQIRVSLEGGFPGLDAWYYVGYLGTPEEPQVIANITVIARLGVGVLGHVFTLPAHRGKGVASALMGVQMAHFRAAGGRALYLGTGFDSTAYRIYARHGFSSLQPGSGAMHWTRDADFYARTFAPKPHVVRPVRWSDWGGVCTLCAVPEGDFIRSAVLPARGAATVEGSFLRLMQRIEAQTASGYVAVAEDESVLGFALWSRPLWDGGRSILVDLYAHPAHLAVLSDLDAALPDERPRLALLDGAAGARRAALERSGYAVCGHLDGEWDQSGAGSDLLILRKLVNSRRSATSSL